MSVLGRIVIGCAIVLMFFLMMIFIFGINILLVIGIFVIGFGLLDDDGFISLGGLVFCLIGVILSGLILVFGYEVVKSVIELIKNFIILI